MGFTDVSPPVSNPCQTNQMLSELLFIGSSVGIEHGVRAHFELTFGAAETVLTCDARDPERQMFEVVIAGERWSFGPFDTDQSTDELAEAILKRLDVA